VTDEFGRGRPEIECPHCRRRFLGELLDGAAARYVGFKCPFCRLFVPLERARDVDAASNATPPRPASPPRAPAGPEPPDPK
jgi:hypothetical protein